MHDDEVAHYYRDAESWSSDRGRAAAHSYRVAWIIAGGAFVVAVLEAIALVLLLPLKTEVPYTLLVDRQTGYVQALKPLDRQTITPDEALIRSLLAQYVIAREEFDIATLQADYRKVALWSSDEARAQYTALMHAGSATNPLATLPRQALIDIEVRSISPLAANTALVRFTTVRSDPGRPAEPPQYWVAVLKYRFSGAAMSAANRLVNPLGFQVLHYRRDAEMEKRQSSPIEAGSYPTTPPASLEQVR